jgi:hypothetical protein
MGLGRMFKGGSWWLSGLKREKSWWKCLAIQRRGCLQGQLFRRARRRTKEGLRKTKSVQKNFTNSAKQRSESITWI